ncbi:MAG: hypothetical protein Q7J34_13405 [Bacteroidales bacterium]|nr:hypothetical protein [Bacteroidales bacterium]
MIEKTNKYLDEDFSENETSHVHERIMNEQANDPDNHLSKIIDESISDWDSIRLRNTLRSMQDEYRSRPKIIGMMIKRKWYLVAASITMVFLMSILGLGMLKPPASPEDLYRDFYRPAKPFMIQRSLDNVGQDYFAQAMSCYSTGKYFEAAKLLIANPNNSASKFYAGIALMELGDQEKAIPYLNDVALDNSSLFVDQAEWYLGLAYLMTEKRENARKQFEKIAATQNYFNDKASEILERLK